MTTELIALWHERGRPDPTEREFNIQLGCHFEEIGESIRCLKSDSRATNVLLSEVESFVNALAYGLKSGQMNVRITDRVGFLDGLADQVVTAIGTGHCANMKIVEAIDRVNTSNWSKYIDGRPVFDENGKIAKPAGYKPPQLGDLV